MIARHKGMQALVEAYAVSKYRELYLISLVGSRESVRGILAAWSSHTPVYLDGDKVRPVYANKTLRDVKLSHGVYHGLGYTQGLYYAQNSDPQEERLWASRQSGIPIPLEVWEDLRAELALEGMGVVALLAPNEHQVRRVLEQRGPGQGARIKLT